MLEVNGNAVRLCVLFVALVACRGDVSNPSSTTSTTAASTSQTVPERSTTSAERSTTSAGPTLFDFGYQIEIYDAFEVNGAVEVGAPCFAVGNVTQLREGTRLVLRDDLTGEAVATALLGPGSVLFDATGPAIGQPGSELFYYCASRAEFTDVPLTMTSLYRLEVATDLQSAVHTGNDLVTGFSWDFLNQDSENERQRLRGGG